MEHKRPNIHAISADRNEYERNKTLLDDSLKEVLNDEKVSKALEENSIEKFRGAKRLYLPSDHCDIRKPHSKEMENLGKVMSLKKEVINGFSSLATIILDENKKDITLGEITVFSNREDRFVSQEELKKYNQSKKRILAKLKKIKWTNISKRLSFEDYQYHFNEFCKKSSREEAIGKLIKSDKHINMTLSLIRQSKKMSDTLKIANPDISLCHIHDSFADIAEYLKHIDTELNDEFVVRGTRKRVSNQTIIDEETEKEKKVKLIDAKFKNRDKEVIEKLRLKGKLYEQAQSIIEWDTTEIEGKTYNVVRVTLQKRDGENIFKYPMLLITNIEVNTYLDAKEIYHIYLLRSKIEAVFKFLKDVLGWEDFQVRDWESIKNIIALTFFIGNYFYEIESTLIEHPTIEIICQLGDGKGKVTRFYFLQGLEKLLIAHSVFQFREDRGISDSDWKEITDFVGV